jgi:hypothetical protein
LPYPMRLRTSNLRRKTAVLLVAIALSAAFAPSASAATFSNCVSIVPNYAPTWHVYRNTATYYAAQGEVVIQQLRSSGLAGQPPRLGRAQADWIRHSWITKRPADMQQFRNELVGYMEWRCGF